MRIEVDKELCCGGSICEEVAPDIFELTDPNGPVTILLPILEGMDKDDLIEDARDACERCPAGAIKLIQ